uniref:F-box domain-containing protein n=1 Tax=Neospora caninum (strain Liverpool) TaxID=572307 RepID=F0JBA3_NEOCL|nr:hypothetical protein, conserved [Neospora caninum Liverpool]CEL71370.1 TPA: hypothetical protein, conserved [Neospora caninum Liverpool]
MATSTRREHTDAPCETVLFLLGFFLPVPDLCKCSAVCKTWWAVCTLQHQQLWREHCLRRFGFKYENYLLYTQGWDWKLMYAKANMFVKTLRKGLVDDTQTVAVHAESPQPPSFFSSLASRPGGQRRTLREESEGDAVCLEKNSKAGHLSRQRARLLPPAFPGYEGSLALTTDCKHLLWENGVYIQRIDLNGSRENWRTRVGCGPRGPTSKPSLVASRTKVICHVNKCVKGFDLGTGKFVCRLKIPFSTSPESQTSNSTGAARRGASGQLSRRGHSPDESGDRARCLCLRGQDDDEAEAIEGDEGSELVSQDSSLDGWEPHDFSLDVSIRNSQVTFLTSRGLCVFHSESLECLYSITHSELLFPSLSFATEDVDFLWAGYRPAPPAFIRKLVQYQDLQQKFFAPSDRAPKAGRKRPPCNPASGLPSAFPCSFLLPGGEGRSRDVLRCASDSLEPVVSSPAEASDRRLLGGSTLEASIPLPSHPKAVGYAREDRPRRRGLAQTQTSRKRESDDTGFACVCTADEQPWTGGEEREGRHWNAQGDEKETRCLSSCEPKELRGREDARESRLPNNWCADEEDFEEDEVERDEFEEATRVEGGKIERDEVVRQMATAAVGVQGTLHISRHIVTWLRKRGCEIKIWDILDGRLLHTVQAVPTSSSFSPLSSATSQSPCLLRVRQAQQPGIPDGYFLAALDSLGRVRFFDSRAAFACVYTVECGEGFSLYRLSLSSSFLVTMQQSSLQAERREAERRARAMPAARPEDPRTQGVDDAHAAEDVEDAQDATAEREAETLAYGAEEEIDFLPGGGLLKIWALHMPSPAAAEQTEEPAQGCLWSFSLPFGRHRRRILRIFWTTNFWECGPRVRKRRSTGASHRASLASPPDPPRFGVQTPRGRACPGLRRGAVDRMQSLPEPCMQLRRKADAWSLLDWRGLSVDEKGELTVRSLCPIADVREEDRLMTRRFTALVKQKRREQAEKAARLGCA